MGFYMRRLSIVVLVFSITLKVLGYSGGPPDGYAANPPVFRNCSSCHSTYPVNSGDGSLTLTGLPANGFVPGQNYVLTLTLADPGQQRWGFELTAQYQSGTSYPQGGTFTVTQPTYTQLSTAPTPDYLKHTSTGTFLGTPGPTSWQFQWTAPDLTVSSVTFYAAGNAANGNGNTSGDYIYTYSATVNQYIAPLPPVVSDIPNQQIAYGGGFTIIDLDDYVTDPDTPDNQIIWTYTGNTNIVISIIDRIATPAPAPGWWGNETITFIATDPTSLFDSDSAVFTVDSAPPPVVYVAVEGDNVVLTWDAVANIEEYHIYYSDDPYFSPQSPPQVVVTAPNLSWSDTGAVNLGQRFYLVLAASN